MSRAAIDLSARPFVNRRPVVRLSLLLWLAGGLLLAGNVWLYWDFIVGRGDLHGRLREVNEGIEIEERRISTLSSELSSFDLGAQNEQVSYLNQRIDQRRFSWSRLFDELSGLLPRDVRLTSLAPTTGDERDGGRRPRATTPVDPGRIELSIHGQARNDQAILDFVDALFADPSFERPNLAQQRQDPQGTIEFDLHVLYFADRPLEADVLEATEAAEVEVDAEVDATGDEAPGDDDSARRSAPGTDGRTPRPANLGRAASSPPELS